MKKNYKIILGALIVLLFVGLGVNYLLSLHKISFNLQSDVKNIVLYTSQEKKIDEITANKSVFLKNGEYYVVPEGESISEDKIYFTVKNEDKTIQISPSYSRDFLNQLLEKEYSNIQSAITRKYPTISSSYNITNGTLYGRGEWFGGLLAPKVSDIRDQRDYYRVVVQKQDDKWEIVRRPEYILSSSRYKEVPVDILKQINVLAP